MDHKYIFDPSTRYMTRGISEQVPIELQLFMWNEIDKVVKAEKVDYLQVFEFKVKDGYLEVEHRQEVPVYKKIHKLILLDGYQVLDKVKIFVIDNTPSHSTMLLASEY